MIQGKAIALGGFISKWNIDESSGDLLAPRFLLIVRHLSATTLAVVAKED